MVIRTKPVAANGIHHLLIVDAQELPLADVVYSLYANGGRLCLQRTVERKTKEGGWFACEMQIGQIAQHSHYGQQYQLKDQTAQEPHFSPPSHRTTE